MKFHHPEDGTQQAGIDMTPMMDIIFILLIFFVLSASFTQSQSLAVDRPSSLTKDKSVAESLVVTIDRHGVIWMDRRALAPGELTAAVRGASSGKTQNAVIHADRHVSSGLLIEVVDKIRLGGIVNVAVATEPKSS